MVDDIAVYVGLDGSKEKIAIGLAEAGRKGAVRYYGAIANRADAVRKLVDKLAGRHGRLCLCYEAGPTGCIANFAILVMNALSPRHRSFRPVRGFRSRRIGVMPSRWPRCCAPGNFIDLGPRRDA